MPYYRIVWNGWTERYDVQRVEAEQVRYDETLYTNYWLAYRVARTLSAPYRHDDSGDGK
jgi:hypothetical protein